jgi:hypothetical protein
MAPKNKNLTIGKLKILFIFIDIYIKNYKDLTILLVLYNKEF